MVKSIAGRWSRGLDLYAGTGALGIEALSEGGNWVDFVEQNPKCCAMIKENLKRAGFATKGRVYCCSVDKALARLDEKYDLIFLDPPYSDSSLTMILERLFSSALVGMDSTVVVQHSYHLSLASGYGWFSTVRERHYGDTCVSIYQRGEEP
jgi:16S rRNA (guanine(966)-N(2))-methyltransferase RsmD